MNCFKETKMFCYSFWSKGAAILQSNHDIMGVGSLRWPEM